MSGGAEDSEWTPEQTRHRFYQRHYRHAVNTQNMTIKAHDTFWQRRELRGMDPILLEVLEVEETIGIRDICKVRWHILGHDSVSTSFFPMASITPGHLADFVSIPRKEFQQALDILKDTTIGYTSRKRRILYLLRKYNYTDDEPLVISK